MPYGTFLYFIIEQTIHYCTGLDLNESLTTIHFKINKNLQSKRTVDNQANSQPSKLRKIISGQIRDLKMMLRSTHK